MEYEYYQALDGHKKRYLIVEEKTMLTDGLKKACRFFKCSPLHLTVFAVWVNGEDMYFSNPHKKGFHKVWAYNYKRRIW